jgi:SAM-dependent methyltransferase
LLFRHPYISESVLQGHYSDTGSGHWDRKAEERSDFNLALKAIKREMTTGKALDIGCHRGDFLALLPPGFQRFGLEASKEAAAHARRRGIEVQEGFTAELSKMDHRFDLITLFNIVEHLQHPLEALAAVKKLLAGGGIVIITTGNTDAFPWRLLPTAHWYLLPEHVSFFNRRWFEWAAARLDLTISQFKKFSYYRNRYKRRYVELLYFALYAIPKMTADRQRLHGIITALYPFSKSQLWTHPVKTKHWPDHALVVLKSVP